MNERKKKRMQKGEAERRGSMNEWKKEEAEGGKNKGEEV